MNLSLTKIINMKKILIFTILILVVTGSKAPIITGFLAENSYNVMVEVEDERREEQKVHEMTLRVLTVIRQIESNDRYHVRGLSGEYGAYQFMPGTWRMYSRKYFGEVLDVTDPEHQDKVAYYKVRDLIEYGYGLKEIASIWNSGSPRWQGKIGVNSHNVAYNVPQYVNNFEYIYFNNVVDAPLTTTTTFFT